MEIENSENMNKVNQLSKETTESRIKKTLIPALRNLLNQYNKILPVILGILLLFAVSAVYYFYRQSSDLRKNMPELAGTAEQAKDIVLKVSQLIMLPADEEPTIATVTELEKLKDQPFFINAKEGDKVLIYNKAKKAILYDPVADKIIEVAPLNIDNQ